MRAGVRACVCEEDENRFLLKENYNVGVSKLLLILSGTQ